MAVLAGRTARLLLPAAILVAVASARAEPVIIAHFSCPVTRLDPDEARKLVLGEDLSWSNGEATQLVEWRDDPVAAAGYLAIARKTPSQVHAEWNRLVFAGRANPPLRFSNGAEVRAAVGRLPGAFAVVDSSLADATVKIVFRARGKR
jgi:hypothetical protein